LAYKISVQNGEAWWLPLMAKTKPLAKMPFHLVQGPTSPPNLKCDASALLLSESLKTMMTETQEALIKRDEKRCHEKEVTTVTFINLTKHIIEVRRMYAAIV
jgi:hypothetical protein